MKQTMVVVGLVAVVALTGLFVASSAEAVSCGDTLGPGGTVTLTSDVGPCVNNTLTVTGPVTVDLAGHTVSCQFQSTLGVVLDGRGAVLKNGRVKGCFWGVELVGDGSHQVTNVVAQENNTGFQVFSSRNALDGNSAVSSGDGFLIDGVFNKFTNNIVTDSTDMGFNVIAATRSTFVGNAVFRSAQFGFSIDGSSNVLTGNTAAANSFGIFLVGSMNTLSLNTLVGNATDAFDTATDCDKNKWLRNVIGVTFQTCIH